MAHAHALHPHRQQITTASGLDALAGIWLFAATFVFAYTPSMEWSCWISGIVVFILAAIRAFGAYHAAWASWVNAAIGLWVVISPWALGADVPGTWNAVITGLAIIVLASWSATATSTDRDRAQPARTI